jgi:peptidoglycan/LPS O-acetylase OafA/YrhL
MVISQPSSDGIRASFGYIPELDGLRGVSILLVIVSHFGFGDLVPGGLGVTIFFFISGFLITRLLIAEYNQAGRISLRAFYARRFLRLAPALLTMLTIVTIVWGLLGNPISDKQIFAAIFYMMNYYYIFGGEAVLPLGPLWSLAVEEHYYLIYPVIFLLFWRFQSRFLLGLICVSLGVLFWRYLYVVYLHGGQAHTYYATDSRIDSILYGAILSVLIETKGSITTYLRQNPIFAWLGFFTIILTLVYRNEVFRETLRYSIQGIALVPIFLSILFSSRVEIARRPLQWPLLIWVGKISYSLYLWHEAAFSFVDSVMPIRFAAANYPTAAILSFALAALSYYGVEYPTRKVRKLFSRQAVLPPQGTLLHR